MKLVDRGHALIGGGIADYKALELIRGCARRCGGALRDAGRPTFVTPLSVGTRPATGFYRLFDRNDDTMGALRLSREAKPHRRGAGDGRLMASSPRGANDIASAVLLAADKTVDGAARTRKVVAPGDGPNARRWQPMVCSTSAQCRAMAESGEAGEGRMARTDGTHRRGDRPVGRRPVAGGRVSRDIGPPRADRPGPISPTAIRESGARACQRPWRPRRRVRLISGPVTIPDPAG